jgi:hypothetical protein
MNLELALQKSLNLLANNGRIVIIDIFSSRKTSLLSYFIEQIVFECLSLNKIYSTIKEIGLVNTLGLLQYRVNFFRKEKYRKHIYEDLENNLPPEKQVWEESVQSITRTGGFKAELSYLSTKVIVIKILKL